MNEVLTEYENTLIQTLRQEAKDVKDCFTRYSFQAIAFASTVLGIIARYQPEYPQIAFAAYASIAMLLTVARIGIYKYGTANRMYGYELHLFRTRQLPDSKGNGWKSEMRLIGWEEAMRAWRIVQVTVFGALYETRRFLPKHLKKIRSQPELYKWFAIEELVEPEAEYHPGTYLGTINKILFGLAIFSCIPLFFMSIQFAKGWEIYCSSQLNCRLWYLVPVFTTLGVLYFAWRGEARRKILEAELLSIHSSAIVWQAVVVAHYRALGNSKGFVNYTNNLVCQANSLVENIYDIHKWVYDDVDFVQSEHT